MAAHHDQPVDEFALGEQGEAQPRGGGQVERHGDVGPAQLVGEGVDRGALAVADGDEGDGELALGAHLLAFGEAVRARAGREDGAQRLVPFQQRAQGVDGGGDGGALGDGPDRLAVDLFGPVAPDAAEHVVLAEGERS